MFLRHVSLYDRVPVDDSVESDDSVSAFFLVMTSVILACRTFFFFVVDSTTGDGVDESATSFSFALFLAITFAVIDGRLFDADSNGVVVRDLSSSAPLIGVTRGNGPGSSISEVYSSVLIVRLDMSTYLLVL